MESITLTPEMLAIIPGIALVLQLLKNVPAFAKIGAWMPFVSIGVGIIYAVLSKMGADVGAQVLTGILMGVAASGGYDTLKNLSNPPKTP